MGPANAAMLRRASSRGWPAGKKVQRVAGARGSAVRGGPTGCLRRLAREKGHAATRGQAASRRRERGLTTLRWDHYAVETVRGNLGGSNRAATKCRAAGLALARKWGPRVGGLVCGLNLNAVKKLTS